MAGCLGHPAEEDAASRQATARSGGESCRDAATVESAYAKRSRPPQFSPWLLRIALRHLNTIRCFFGCVRPAGGDRGATLRALIVFFVIACGRVCAECAPYLAGGRCRGRGLFWNGRCRPPPQRAATC